MALIQPTSIWRQANPRGAVRDFMEVWRQAGRNRWRIALLSAAVTGAIFSMIWQEGWVGPPIRPTIDYITVWDPHRTDAEIMASNIENQKRKERLAAEQARRDEEAREVYRTLGRMSGMDVDGIEAKAKAEREAALRARADAREKAQAAAEAASSSPEQAVPQAPPKAPIAGE